MNTSKMIVELYDLGTKPHHIAKFLNVPLERVDLEVEDYDNMILSIVRSYRDNEVPRIQKSLSEMKSEVPDFEKSEMRRLYLLGQLRELKKDPTNPRLKKLLLEIKIFTRKMRGISPEMIVRAREYPITELIKSVRGVAKCPFHSDSTPSMDIRKNFYHCYGCGAQGDVIDLVMKKNGMSFVQAVMYLSR